MRDRNVSCSAIIGIRYVTLPVSYKLFAKGKIAEFISRPPTIAIILPMVTKRVNQLLGDTIPRKHLFLYVLPVGFRHCPLRVWAAAPGYI